VDNYPGRARDGRTMGARAVAASQASEAGSRRRADLGSLWRGGRQADKVRVLSILNIGRSCV
jgi:hypothetical protein